MTEEDLVLLKQHEEGIAVREKGATFAQFADRCTNDLWMLWQPHAGMRFLVRTQYGQLVIELQKSDAGTFEVVLLAATVPELQDIVAQSPLRPLTVDLGLVRGEKGLRQSPNDDEPKLFFVEILRNACPRSPFDARTHARRRERSTSSR